MRKKYQIILRDMYDATEIVLIVDATDEKHARYIASHKKGMFDVLENIQEVESND